MRDGAILATKIRKRCELTTLRIPRKKNTFGSIYRNCWMIWMCDSRSFNNTETDR